jgi:hypothetical protein
MLRYLLTLLCIGFTISLTAQTGHEPGTPLPAFKLIVPDDVEIKTTDSLGHTLPPSRLQYAHHVYTDKDLVGKANLFILTFNPMCDHCSEVTTMLIQNVALFKHSKIVLVANPDLIGNLSYFMHGLHRTSLPPQMILGIDASGYIDNTFTYEGLPQINIYGHDGKLLKVFTSGVTMDALKPYIE